jgi:signal transduction histidine kinase
MALTPPPSVSDHARLAALYEVSQALNSSLNLDEALVIVMDAAIRLTHAERGFLMLFDDETGELAFRIARSNKQETLFESGFEVSRSVLREVAQTGTPVVTTNAQDDPRFAKQESVVQFALRSIMAVPLMVRGRIIGVLYVDNKIRAGTFEETGLGLLNSFASQAAIAIENARLYTQTDQALAARVAELQTMQKIDRQLNAAFELDKVVRLTLEFALQRTQAQSGWIGLGTDDGMRVVAGQAAGLGEMVPLDHPFLKRVLAKGQPQRLTPWPGEATFRLVVPAVVRDGKVIGVIVAEREGHPFSASAEEFLVRLADHAAIAIENARLYAAVKHANDAKSKFVSIVSHELKLPMTSIKGYADLLRQGVVGGVNEQQVQFLNVIRSNVERMAVLVSDLSDISRIETGRLKIEIGSVEVAPFVEEALVGLRGQIEAKGQTLSVKIPPNLPRVRSDKSRLIQILSNLVSNAHKYSPSGAPIVVAAERVMALPPMVLSKTGLLPQPHIRLSVTDQGYGISPEDQAKLFSQFFRSDDPLVREQAGWGLGLHITRRLVELLGGEISLQSAPGKGSTFAFIVPVDV